MEQNLKFSEISVIKYYSKLIDDNPDDIVYYSNRGFALLKIGDIYNAKNDFMEICIKKPDHFLGYLCLGLLYSRTKEFITAIENLTEAIDVSIQPI